MPKIRAHAPRTIYVHTLLDTDPLLKLGISTNPGSPVGLDKHRYVYMVVDSDNLESPQTQATGNLNIKGEVNDVINWRASSLSGAGEAVFFYKFNASTPGIISPPAQQQTHPTSVAVPDSPLNSNDPRYHFKQLPTPTGRQRCRRSAKRNIAFTSPSSTKTTNRYLTIGGIQR